MSDEVSGQDSLELYCPVCGTPVFVEGSVACNVCQTPHHKDCWEYNEGCAIYGCKNALEGIERRDLSKDALSQLPNETFVFCFICSIAIEYLCLTSFSSALFLMFAIQIATLSISWFSFTVPQHEIFALLGLLAAIFVTCILIRYFFGSSLKKHGGWRPFASLVEGCGQSVEALNHRRYLRRLQKLALVATVASRLLTVLIDGVFSSTEGLGSGLTPAMHDYFFLLGMLGVSLMSTWIYLKAALWSTSRLFEWRSIHRSLKLPFSREKEHKQSLVTKDGQR